MEPEGSLPSSQELSTCTYPEPDQSSPKTIFFKTMRFSDNTMNIGKAEKTIHPSIDAAGSDDGVNVC
jgi:hypothetical protein